MLSCDKFTLSSELVYEQTYVNVDIRTINNDILGYGDYKIEYLAYYLNGKFVFPGNVFQPYLSGGPKLDVYVGDKVTNTSMIPEENYRLASDNLSKVIFGINLGAGIEIKSGKKFSILCEINFSPALASFYEESNVSAKSNSLSFKTGTKFYF